VPAVKGREHLHGFVDADLLRQVRRLQTNANAILELLALPVGIEAENGNFASAARAQAFQNLDRGGLAGAVGSEQAENFTGLDLEVDSFHGVDLTVGLLQAVDRDRCATGSSSRGNRLLENRARVKKCIRESSDQTSTRDGGMRTPSEKPCRRRG
jgi:hypothetical protein